MEVMFGNQAVRLKGNTKNVGDKVEDFTVINNDLKDVKLSDFKDVPYLLISAVPSLDTGTCDYQTKTFNKALNDMKHIKVLTISNDLPFAQKRWCGNVDLKDVITLSDHRDLSFAHAFGTLIEAFRLQARAVFILDQERKVIYSEYVQNVSEHPSYDKIIKKVETLK